MTELLLPPEIKEVDRPTIFLAGPIEGSWDWQAVAADIIRSDNRSSELVIASPRKNYSDHGEVFDGNKQKEWEVVNYHRAARFGACLFWLLKQTEHGWEDEGAEFKRSYAQTSRFELADLATMSAYEDVNIVLGIEPGFGGESYIRFRHDRDFPEVPITTTLEETCLKAVDIAFEQVTETS